MTLATSAHGYGTTQKLFQIAAAASGSAACGATAEGGLLELACQQLLKQPSLDAIMACRHGQSLLKEVLPEGCTMQIRGRSPAQSMGR